MNRIFKYKGEDFAGYEYGQIYLLDIVAPNTQRNGIKQRPAILAPINIQYEDWAEFFNNWETV